MLTNITFSVDENLIIKAREKASAENSSLNVVFRKWLKQYTEREQISDKYDQVMESLKQTRTAMRYSRPLLAGRRG